MDETSGTVDKYLKLKKKNISLLQFILEGYEGFATVTTIDKNAAVVKLFIMPDFISAVADLLASLKTVMDIEEIPAIPMQTVQERR